MKSSNEKLVMRLWDIIWGEQSLDKLGEVLTDPFVRHNRDGTQTMSPKKYATHISSTVATIQPSTFEFDHLCSLDDHVYARFTLQCVNVAVGCNMKITWLAQYRIENGLIAEFWSMHQTDLDW